MDQDLLVPTFRIGIPDRLVDHASPQESKNDLGLTSEQIADRIRKRFSFNSSESLIASTSNS